MKVRYYCVIDNKLFKRALVEPLLRYIDSNESKTIMLEVYSGICGEHLTGKNMELKISDMECSRR